MSIVPLLRGWLPGLHWHQVRRLPRAGYQLQMEELESRFLLSATPAPALHFDFGTSGSPIAPGYTGVSLDSYSARRGYGWQSLSGLSAIDRGTSDPLSRDLLLGRDNTFLVNLPNGTYDVTATLGDAKYARDQVIVWAEGKQVASGLTSAAGEFLKPTFRVNVVDGQLNLRVADGGGKDPYFALCGLDITPSASSAPLTALYVSTSGSDSNNGESVPTAFRTIAAAAAHATYGMTIYLEGGTYYEPLVPKSDGAPGQGITFTSDNGTAIIDGSTQTWAPGSNQNQGLAELRHPYVTLRGLKIVNSPNTGVVLGADNVTVDSCEVASTQRHAISTDTRFQLAAPGTGTMLHNLTITNNNVYQAVLMGQGYGQAISLIADGFLVSGNAVHDNLTEGIDIWLGARHGEVAGNNTFNNGKTGIYVDGASYVRIDDNTSYGNGSGIGVSSENVNYSTHDIWVYNNVVHDNASSGIFIWDSSTNPGYAGSQNVLIANNTLVNNPTSIYLAGSGNTAEVMNNLSYTTGRDLYNSATNSTFLIHNNVWLVSLDGFVSAASYDYRLTSSAPAIDQGAPIPSFSDDLGNTYLVAYDFLGSNRVANGAPDAGAYEYQGPV